MKILFATTNKAKLRRYANKLIEDGVEIVTLSEMGIDINVDEDGKSAIENAVIKAKAYNLVSKLPTISVDDVLYLDNVPEHIQPGTNVRRINGKTLNDKEMIEYYTNLVDKYGTDGKLKGYFIKGVAIAYNDIVLTHEVKAPRIFLNASSPKIDEGYPLASIQLIPEFNKFKSELTKEEEEIVNNKEQEEISEFILNTIKNI